jgi:NADPH-dependent 2,4-dienoyl-CoA reductase/sulfur reductase-like enzyme/nitrite reductase/ring-hydroxylating ferredoxin subunit
MAENENGPAGPDLALGIAAAELPEGGKLAGHVGEEAVLLLRQGSAVFAVGAHCTHYHAPLADGLVTGRRLHCPWHHAVFDLDTGEALHAPAFSPLGCWSVEQREGKIFVHEKRKAATSRPGRAGGVGSPERIVIVGGGGAGFAAAERLRREGYTRSLVMLSSDRSAPVDRPNLSKDYMAGKAPEDWVPLQGDSFYAENEIGLRLDTTVVRIEPRSREVVLADDSRIPYDRLLLATGAEPIRPTIPGSDQPHVHTLRSLADCRAVIEQAKTARRAVILGASFIGLEVAAALRAREIEVHVVAPEALPMERILGPQLGEFVRSLHEKHGVVFHLGTTASAVIDKKVTLADGVILDADLVVAGLGVRPRTGLAEKAGLALDRGVLVNAYLESSLSGIFAAGDIARWPDPHSGENIRVEHWVVAERQGQCAALNMLGQREKFTAVPFFWSQHYDIPINYVGHAPQWDELDVEGDIAENDCLVRYKHKGRLRAVASIFRDLESLQAEIAMARG